MFHKLWCFLGLHRYRGEVYWITESLPGAKTKCTRCNHKAPRTLEDMLSNMYKH